MKRRKRKKKDLGICPINDEVKYQYVKVEKRKAILCVKDNIYGFQGKGPEYNALFEGQ